VTGIPKKKKVRGRAFDLSPSKFERKRDDDDGSVMANCGFPGSARSYTSKMRYGTDWIVRMQALWHQHAECMCVSRPIHHQRRAACFHVDMSPPAAARAQRLRLREYEYISTEYSTPYVCMRRCAPTTSWVACSPGSGAHVGERRRSQRPSYYLCIAGAHGCGSAPAWTSERRRLLSCTCTASACMGSDERARVEMQLQWSLYSAKRAYHTV
jgi:hypothetical protein